MDQSFSTQLSFAQVPACGLDSWIPPDGEVVRPAKEFVNRLTRVGGVEKTMRGLGKTAQIRPRSFHRVVDSTGRGDRPVKPPLTFGPGALSHSYAAPRVNSRLTLACAILSSSAAIVGAGEFMQNTIMMIMIRRKDSFLEGWMGLA